MNLLTIILGVLSMAKAALDQVLQVEDPASELYAILKAVDSALGAAITDLQPHLAASNLTALPPAVSTALLGALQVAKTAVEIAAAIEMANPLVAGILKAVDAAITAAISALQSQRAPLPAAAQ